LRSLYVGKTEIRVQSVNKKGLLELQKILLQFQIKSNFYSYERKQKNWKTNYHLAIMRRGSRVKFLKYIGFNHIKKLQKLIATVA
jgi:intein/homing endonuclease